MAKRMAKQLLALLIVINLIAVYNLYISYFAHQGQILNQANADATATANADTNAKQSKRKRRTRNRIEPFQREAARYLDARLRECGRQVVIIPSKDVGVGLLFTQVLLLVNRALDGCHTPVVTQGQDMVWFSSESRVAVTDIFHLDEVALTSESTLEASACEDMCDQNAAMSTLWMPEQFQSHGIMWWYKQLASYFVRPSVKLLQQLFDLPALKASGIRAANLEPSLPQPRWKDLFDIPEDTAKPVIALHLRRGDSCQSLRPPCMKDGREAFKRLKDQGIAQGTILLATDSARVAATTIGQAERRGFTVYTLRVDRTFYKEFEKKYDGTDIDQHPRLAGQIRETSLVLESLLDLALLAQGELHVGSFYSNFIRVAMSFSTANSASRYISFDSKWCPFEACSLGWQNSVTCPRWHKHLCQWRPRGYCDKKFNIHCGQLANPSCSQDCTVYTLSILALTKQPAVAEMTKRVSTPFSVFTEHNLCCSNKCQKESWAHEFDETEGPHCPAVKAFTSRIAAGIESFYVPQTPPPKAGACRGVDDDTTGSIKEAVARGRRNSLNHPIGFERPVPGPACEEPWRDTPYNFEEMKRAIKRSRLAIVYMAQKKHASYGSDSYGKLTKSLDLLYENYNNVHHDDVLIFHEGDFNEKDLPLLRGQDGSRKEVHLIRLDGDYWSLPGHLRNSDPKSWEDNQFTVGYRHMCRWYAGKLFEFMNEMGYEYVMRMDDDSFLHSPIGYNVAEFMETNGYEYAYRLDAFEPCCYAPYRKAYIDLVLNDMEDEPTFYNECCKNDKDEYNNYGYYNNFFVSKISFWMQPKVRRLFNFVDWTGGIYTFRENDLVLQSLSVQLFMPLRKVHKFNDWSYEHITNTDRCEWGGISLGTDAHEKAKAQLMKYHRRFPSHAIRQFDPVTKQLTAIYCEKTLYKANVEVDFHTKAAESKEKMVYFDTTRRDVRNALMASRLGSTESALFKSTPWTTQSKTSTVMAQSFRKLLERMASDCTDQEEVDSSIWLEEPECGGGCTISFMVKPILYALKHRLNLVTPGSRWLHGKRGCKANDISCFLRSFASPRSCGSTPRKPKNSHGQWRVISQDDEDFFQEVSGERSIPSEFRKLGMFWVVSQIIDFLMQPSPYVQSLIDGVVKKTGLDLPENQPVLGVHVRMGDACSDPKKDEKGRECEGLDRFLADIKTMVTRFGYRSIYLATDSHQALAEARSKHTEFKWLFNDKINRTRYEAFARASADDDLSIEGVLFGNKKLKAAGFVAFDEMSQFLVDTIILGRYTQGLVGKFTSNMDRVVASLLSVNVPGKNRLPPVVSLDAPWCADFMVNSVKSYNGRPFYC